MPKYCPKCKSRLYPVDEEYIEKHGMCSYCVTVRRLSKPKPKSPRKQIIHFFNKEV